MKVALALFVLSLVLVGASVPMAPFQLTPDGSYPMFGVPEGDSEAYYVAWKQAVTVKFRLQDYGVTLLLCALILAVSNWRPFKAPRSVLGFVILAVAAPAVMVGGYVFDLAQAMARWEFPSWADSIGIPLMGVPVIFVAGLAWAFGHFVLLAGVPRRAGVTLSLLAMRRGHPWLLLVGALTALLTLAMAAEGAYWYALPGTVWLYFYAAIAAVRHNQHDA